MARKIQILIQTALNQLVIQDYDDETGDINNQFYGAFGGINVEQANQLENLTDPAHTIRLIWDGGSTGFFNHGQIETAEVNGVGIPQTNLGELLQGCAPYFFRNGVAEIVADYPVTSATTELDFSSIGQANIIQLTSADSAMTISRILNIPANREIKIMPPLAATLTIARTMQVAMSDNWQVLSSANHVCEGSKGEFVKVARFQSATWTIAQVTSFLTNLV